MDVRGAFVRLLRELSPGDSTIALAADRFSSVRTRLRACFGDVNVQKMGSASRNTHVKALSDIDVLVRFPRDECRRGSNYITSSALLDRVRTCLVGRWPNTDIGRDGQAVVVQFGNMSIDVVPSFFHQTGEKGWPLYAMPNGTDDWMLTNPAHHNSYLRRANERSGSKIRRTAQLMKYWRHTRSPSVRISSFYIEMLLATEGVCNGVKSYPQCLADLFGAIQRRQCGAVPDPLEISGGIAGCNTEAQRRNALASVRDARYHADLAIAAEEDGDMREARRQWSIVFNHTVPWFRT